MKSQQIKKRSYEMNIIFQKEKQSKFTLLEAMSFHSEVWRRNREAQGQDGTVQASPIFGRSVNPIPIWGKRGGGQIVPSI